MNKLSYNNKFKDIKEEFNGILLKRLHFEAINEYNEYRKEVKKINRNERIKINRGLKKGNENFNFNVGFLFKYKNIARDFKYIEDNDSLIQLNNVVLDDNLKLISMNHNKIDENYYYDKELKIVFYLYSNKENTKFIKGHIMVMDLFRKHYPQPYSVNFPLDKGYYKNNTNECIRIDNERGFDEGYFFDISEILDKVYEIEEIWKKFREGDDL